MANTTVALEWRPWATYLVSNVDGMVMNKHGKILQPAVNSRTGYEQLCVTVDGEQFSMAVHRLVAMAFVPNPLDKPNVDHIDGDPMNNDAANLRWATKRQNSYNRRSCRGSSSRHKGVSRSRATGKWVASIKVHGRPMYLGSFLEEDDAGYTYDSMARTLHGPFVRLNLPRTRDPAEE